MSRMNYLDKLLDGVAVEWRALGTVADIGTGSSNRQDESEKGIYRFLAIEHKLLAIKVDESLLDEAIPAFLNQKTIANAAVTFIWVAVAERMVWRFGERGYRYLLLDAGHICQNLYLAGQNVNCGTCAIAAFDDDAVNRFLNLDGEELFVAYAATVGKY